MAGKKLSTGMIVGISIAAVLFILIVSFIGMYNGIVKLDNNVEKAWGQVENVYQRRADLIPNLVETVKGAKNFEQGTLVAITQARSAWTNAKTTEEKVAAANGIESALSRLMVVVENYPDLKATVNFQSLQDELANTENKISVERMRYNEAVGGYNEKVRTFPSNIAAGLFGFSKKSFFEATPGAETAPAVKFE